MRSTLLPLHAPTRTRAGFTLIELMITVAIIAILAAIAMPSYTRYVTRAKRSAAESYMQTLAARLEQYRLDQRAYTSTVADVLSPPSEVSDNYDISITLTTGSPPGYTIEAAPRGTQATADAGCGTLKLSQDGTREVTGVSALGDCW